MDGRRRTGAEGRLSTKYRERAEVVQHQCPRDQRGDSGEEVAFIADETDDPKNQGHGKGEQYQQPSKGRERIASAGLEEYHADDGQPRDREEHHCHLAVTHEHVIQTVSDTRTNNQPILPCGPVWGKGPCGESRVCPRLKEDGHTPQALGRPT